MLSKETPMPGRFSVTSPPETLRAFFAYLEEPDFPPRYNIAPTQPIAIVTAAAHSQGARRHFTLMRWGFLPGFVKDPKNFSLLINARAETLTEKASFRAAVKRRRCLVVADSFYEWVRREVVCVIVRRSHPAGPAVPSAVPYEVGRIGNAPSKSPRTMYPTVSRRIPEPRGNGTSASIKADRG
jgi:hypothetical protein